MDWLLGPLNIMSFGKTITGLNPYCNGLAVRPKTMDWIKRIFSKSLNPYCNGLAVRPPSREN